jgi:hypothetical protein
VSYSYFELSLGFFVFCCVLLQLLIDCFAVSFRSRAICSFTLPDWDKCRASR